MAERALELVLPWPSKDLSPNARVPWRRKARATKSARYTGMFLAMKAGWRGMPLPPGRIYIQVDFYPPPGQKRPDDDNMVGRFKPFRDGIADALGIDDGRFVGLPFVHDERRRGGQAVVRIMGGSAPGGTTMGDMA